MWVLTIELWCINEEKLQFLTDDEYKHDVAKELGMFQQLKELFLVKMEKVSKFDAKKKSAYAFEQSFAKATQGTDLLSKIQSRIRDEGDATPAAKEALPPQPPPNTLPSDPVKADPTAAGSQAAPNTTVKPQS
jgi:hypothetical protein